MTEPISKPSETIKVFEMKLPVKQDLPANTEDLQWDPSCAHSMLNRIFEPRDASVILTSGDGGTGKTFSAIEIAYDLATKLHLYILTNDLFIQKTQEGWREVSHPHERVRTIKTMRDFWIAYAEILKADPFAIVVPVFDEWQKYMHRLAWWDKIVTSTLAWWSENRKFRTVPFMITQKMRNIPRQLLPYVTWYIAKSRQMTQDYNDAKGTDYSFKELGFVIKVLNQDELEKRKEIEFTLSDVVQVLQFARGPWTGDRNTAKVGDICYDSWSSANLTMGEVGGTQDWFEEFMAYISSCPSFMIADKILEFFEEGRSKASVLDQVPNAEIGLHIYRQLKSKMPPEATGHPIIKLSPHKGRKLVPVELNPSNLARLVDCSQGWISRKLERST
jgi:hypothetical protein